MSEAEEEFKPSNKTPWFTVVALLMLSGIGYWGTTFIPAPPADAKPTIYQPREKITRGSFESREVEPQPPRTPDEIEKQPGW